MSSYDFARGVEGQQLAGNLLNSFLGFGLDLLPLGRAQPIDPWGMVGHANVAAQAIGLVYGHVQLVAGSVFHQQIFALAAVQAHLYQPRKQADAVLHVHHVGTGLHIGKERLGCHRAWTPRPPGNGPGPSEDFGVGQQVERGLGGGGIGVASPIQDPAFGQSSLHQGQAAGWRGLADIGNRRSGYRPILKEFRDTLRLAADDDYALSSIAHCLAAIQHALELAAVALAVGKEPA